MNTCKAHSFYFAALASVWCISSAVAGGPALGSSVLNLQAPTLPPGFKGNDCRAVASALAQAKLSKGEFETTEQFRSRVDAFKDATSIAGLKAGSAIGFVSPIRPEQAIYDADAGRMSVQIEQPLLGSLSSAVSRAGFAVNTTIIRRSSYRASNAFGKVANVKQTYGSVCAVGFVNQTYDPLAESVSVPIDVPADRAKLLKKSLALLYVGLLAEPYLEKYMAYSKPTIDHPYEYAWDGDTIGMSLSQIWIFDTQTGKIFIKLDRP